MIAGKKKTKGFHQGFIGMVVDMYIGERFYDCDILTRKTLIHYAIEDFKRDIKRKFGNWHNYNLELAFKNRCKTIGYYRKMKAKEYGFNSISQYQEAKAKENGFKSKFHRDMFYYFKKRGRKIKPQEYYDELAKRKGFKNREDYNNFLARKRGFKDNNEYRRDLYRKNKIKKFKNLPKTAKRCKK